MSRILEAMRKSSVGAVDLDVRLATLDRGNLFPPPDLAMAREFEQLATNLIHLREKSEKSVVVFASSNSGEGSSYVSYNCARIMSLLLDKKIAWVDGNFSSPSVKTQANDLNLKDLLADPTTLPAFSEGSGLVVVGNGRRNVKSLHMLNSENYTRLVKRFEESFYFTIFDGPPILGSVEVAHMAQRAMGLVLVVESQRLKYEVIHHGLEKLRSQDVEVLGTVLNKRTYQLPEFIYKRL